jgi:hypothetical protein
VSSPAVNQRIIKETKRLARGNQSLIGWIFWDPGAERRYEALGVPGRLGYVGTRAAPLAPAGDDAVIAAFSTIHPNIVRAGLAAVRRTTTFDAMWEARDDAVVEGLRAYLTSEQCDALIALRDDLWRAVEACPVSGRTFFAAHLALERPAEPLLSAWHAASAVREWRADTHMAILVREDLNAVEASILHSAWMGYPHDWVARSRGWQDEEVAAGFASLGAKGLADAADGLVSERGVALREAIEERTDELGAIPWAAIGLDATTRIADVFEEVASALLRRVDDTAGKYWMPAARGRNPYGADSGS